MQTSLKSRSIKISSSTKSSVGTGILIDSFHILTCAHVIQSVLKGGEEITDTTPIEILPIGNAADEWLTATIVHSYLESEKGANGVRRYIFPKYPKDFDDAKKLKFDYVKDIILLKTQQPVFPNVSFIDWQDDLGSDKNSIEVFGNQKDSGELFTVKLEGEGYYKLHQCRLVDSAHSLGGASGTGLLLEVNSVTDQVIGYGMLIGESKITQEGKKVVERAFYISGEYIQPFLSSYEGLVFPSNGRVKRTKPQNVSESDKRWLFDELALPIALLDRDFIDEIENSMEQKGLVCLTLTATERDWFFAVGLRVSEMFRLSELGDRSTKHVQVNWPSKDGSISGFDGVGLATKVIERIRKAMAFSKQDSSGYDDFFETFHKEMKGFARVAIAISGISSSLTKVEQEALAILIKEFQVYNKIIRPDSNTQVLLYLVIDHEWLATLKKPLFERLGIFPKKKTIESVTRDLDHRYQCWFEQDVTLRPILDSDIEPWIDKLTNLSGLDQSYFNDVYNHAQRIIGGSYCVKHKVLRRELEQYFYQFQNKNL